MQLNDYSDMKKGGVITIPLNGETYEAYADPPADVSLESIGAMNAADLQALAKVIEQQKAGETVALDIENDPQFAAAAMRAGSAGLTHTHRAVMFFQHVLTPESAERWAANMRPPDPEASKAEQKKHIARQITLQQVMAVHRELVAVYGGRPTTPPSSSQNGHGGTGGTSTAGASAGA
jgi:DNA-binding NarL/FixJ family response regulator